MQVPRTSNTESLSELFDIVTQRQQRFQCKGKTAHIPAEVADDCIAVDSSSSSHVEGLLKNRAR